MKYILEIPEEDEAFVLEVLRRVTSVKITPVRRRVAKPIEIDTTDYILSSPTEVVG